jgi:pimeloyl-ACP methyl ester carboxylesterase
MTNDIPSTNVVTLAQVLLRAVSLMLLVPIAVLIIFALITPLTLSGIVYIIGAVALVLGIASVAWGFRRYKRVLWIGLALIILVAAARLIMLNAISDKIRLLTLPSQSSLCIIDCLIDEQDASLVSSHVLPLIGWISPAEHDGLLDAMSAGYRSLSGAQPLAPSPFVRTYLGLQNPDAFDAVVIEPDNPESQTGLIFLHGFTGNFTMPCWLVAGAALDAVTVCPSVGWEGYWWIPDGEKTLRETIDYLHHRGITRIYLAGLSNGGVGISEVAYKLTADIAGLILISGASLDAQDSGLPVLVLSGIHDERMPTDMLHAYADHMGTNATFISFDSDHFMLAKKTQEVQRAIAAWLQQH